MKPLQDMDDLEKLHYLAEIEANYTLAQIEVVPGVVSMSTIDKFKKVIEHLEQLLLAGLPKVVEPKRVQDKIASSKQRIAFIYSLFGNPVQSQHYYAEAAEIYEEIGKPDMADYCRANIKSQEFTQTADVNNEIQRLYGLLDTAPQGSLQHTDVLVELAELFMTTGDAFEAEHKFHDALQALREMGYEHFPSAKDIRIAADRVMDDINAGKVGGGPSQHIILVQVEGLYRRIYTGLSNIYQKTNREEQGKVYEELIKAMNRGEFEEGSEQLALQQLYDQMREIEKQVRRSSQEVIGDGKLSKRLSRRHAAIPIVDPFQLRQELDMLAHENTSRPIEASRDDLLEKAQALEIKARRTKIPWFIAESLIQRAAILMTLRQDEEALSFLKKARRALKEVGKQDLLVQVLSMMAEIHARNERWNVVASLCRQGVELVEAYRYNVSAQYLQNAYLRSRIKLYTLAVQATYIQRNFQRMLYYAELSKCHFSLRYMQQISASIKTQENLEQEFRQVDTEIDALRSQRESGDHLEVLLQKRRVLWDQMLIERLKVQIKEETPEFNVKKVQSFLARDEAIIYYYWLDSGSLLSVTIDRRHIIPELHMIDQHQQEHLRAFARFILTLDGAKRINYLQDSISAFSSFLLPTKARTLLERKRRLLISPHRLLHALPFHAMKWHDNFLVERFAVTYVPNLSSLLFAYTPSHQPRVLAIGTNDYSVAGKPVRFLQEAEQEVENLQQMYKKHAIPLTLLKGLNATEQCLYQLERMGRLEEYTCIHLALHGYSVMSDTPMESFLVLRDSIIEGLEIANWRLEAGLVVLSACSSGQRPISGRGMEELPGDELFGLQAAFFMAGARKILSALWPVDDAAATQITITFHRHIIEERPPEVALQLAMKEYLTIMQTNLRSKKVYYWAPFFLSTMGRPQKPGDV